MNRYKGIDRNIDNDRGRYISNAIYPTIPETEDDIYIIASSGDRYDTLASSFYNDSSLWWIIASSNNHDRSSLTITPGVQIRIPADKTLALQLFEAVNKTR